MAEIDPLADAGRRLRLRILSKADARAGCCGRALSPSLGMTFWRQKYIVTELDIQTSRAFPFDSQTTTYVETWQARMQLDRLQALFSSVANTFRSTEFR
jgi:hypothetical protein